MPISIEEALQGEVPEFGAQKKVDKDQLREMLSQQAYTIAELAEMFGVTKATIRQYLYKMKKEEGVNVQSRRVNGSTYYFITE